MPTGKFRAAAGGVPSEASNPATLTPDPVIEAYKRDIDRSLLRERLKTTPAERVQDLVELARFAEEHLADALH